MITWITWPNIAIAYALAVIVWMTFHRGCSCDAEAPMPPAMLRANTIPDEEIARLESYVAQEVYLNRLQRNLLTFPSTAGVERALREIVTMRTENRLTLVGESSLHNAK